MNTNDLNDYSRLVIIRFCLTRGTRLKCSTRDVMRPLEMKDLEAAFEEQTAYHKGWRKEYLGQFNDSKKREELYLSIFGTDDPPQEDVDKYLEEMKRQEDEIFNSLRKSYIINVGYAYLSEESLAFHRSMNPHVSFGYSNVLHEECDCLITDELRGCLLRSLGYEVVDFSSQMQRYGAFYCKGSDTYYEDLIVWHDDRILLSTITHELMFNVCFNEEDIKAFRTFEGMTERNEIILSRMSSE